MKLLDKIALDRVLSMFFSFLLSAIKLFMPQKQQDKKWFPRVRRRNEKSN
jgi:hypothetical protein